jgi:hypothetical protein
VDLSPIFVAVDRINSGLKMGNYCQECSDTKNLGFEGEPAFTFKREFRGEQLSDRILATADVAPLICTLADKEGLEPFALGVKIHLVELTITWQWRGDGWKAWQGTYTYHVEEVTNLRGKFTDAETYAISDALNDGALPIGIEGDTLQHNWEFGGGDHGGVIIAVVSDCAGY